MKKITLTAIVLQGIIGLGHTATADEIQCNRQQTKCVTETRNVTIGDQVGVFNEDGELVATGEVRSMRGDRRAFLVNQKYGKIRKGYSLALMETRNSDASTSLYRIYREPSNSKVGASVGYSSFNIGEGSPAVEVSPYMQWRKWRGIQVVARGVYTAMEGTITHRGDEVESLPISMTGFGVLGGVGYTFRETKPLAFRGEVAGGFMHISASVDGDAGLIGEPGYPSKIANGFAPYGRWSLGAVYNMNDWHLHTDFAQSLVHEALAYTLAMGVSRDLK